MKHVKNYLAILFIFIGLACNGQHFKIVNAYNTSTLKKSDFIELVVGDTKKVEACCTRLELHGNIVSVDSDSILFNTDILHLTYDSGREKTGYSEWCQMGQTNRIAKKDILRLNKYKTEKSRKAKSSLSIAGGILLFTGLGTALGSLVVSDKEDRKNLLLAGGVQVGCGFIMGLAIKPEYYKFSGTENPWRFE